MPGNQLAMVPNRVVEFSEVPTKSVSETKPQSSKPDNKIKQGIVVGNATAQLEHETTSSTGSEVEEENTDEEIVLGADIILSLYDDDNSTSTPDSRYRIVRGPFVLHGIVDTVTSGEGCEVKVSTTTPNSASSTELKAPLSKRSNTFGIRKAPRRKSLKSTFSDGYAPAIKKGLSSAGFAPLHNQSLVIKATGGRYVLNCEQLGEASVPLSPKPDESHSRVQLDLNASLLRNRLVLREGMEIVFGETESQVVVVKSIGSCCAPCTYTASRGSDHAATYNFTNNQLERRTASFQNLIGSTFDSSSSLSTGKQMDSQRKVSDESESSDYDGAEVHTIDITTRTNSALSEELGKLPSSMKVLPSRQSAATSLMSTSSSTSSGKVKFGSSFDAESGHKLFDLSKTITARSSMPENPCSLGGNCQKFPTLALEVWELSDAGKVEVKQASFNVVYKSNRNSGKWYWTIGSDTSCDIQLVHAQETVSGIIECRGTNWFLLTDTNNHKKTKKNGSETKCTVAVRVDNVASGFDIEQKDVFRVGRTARVELCIEPAALKPTKAISSSQKLSDINIEVHHAVRTKQWSGTSVKDAVAQSQFPYSMVVNKKGHWGTIIVPSDSGKDHIKFGKDPSQCRGALNDPKLAKVHFVVTKKARSFTVTPLSASRPMYVVLSSRAINWRNSLQLRPGVVFRVGCSEYRVLGVQDSHSAFPIESKQSPLLDRVTPDSASIQFTVKRDQRQKVDELGEVITEESVDIEYMDGEDLASEETFAVEEHVRGRDVSFDDVVLDHGLCFMEGPYMVLHCTKGPLQKRLYLINRPETCIGNDPQNHIPIWNDVEMAALQCRIVYEGKSWYLQDISHCERTSRTELETTTVSRGFRRRYSSIGSDSNSVVYNGVHRKVEGATAMRLPTNRAFVLQAGDVLLAGDCTFAIRGTRCSESVSLRKSISMAPRRLAGTATTAASAVSSKVESGCGCIVM